MCVSENRGTRCMIENVGDDIVISRYLRVSTSNMVSCAVCVLSTGCCADCFYIVHILVLYFVLLTLLTLITINSNSNHGFSCFSNQKLLSSSSDKNYDFRLVYYIYLGYMF